MLKQEKRLSLQVTAVLSKTDLKLVDELAAEAGVTREEALRQLLCLQLRKQLPTLH